MIIPRLAVLTAVLLLVGCRYQNKPSVITVDGPVHTDVMGMSLIHEHLLVDFIGADSTGYHRWDRKKVITKVLPFLKEARGAGISTFISCTPAYLGRDPVLLKVLSDSSGLNILTNTGYYGARSNKFLPPHAFTESADELANRWASEFTRGIEDTGIKPGFIKISVDPDSLSPLHQKLVIAAARTHRQTGLTIASHTGPATPAFQQLAILEREGVSPHAFIWVHAQSEKDESNHIKGASKGAWISLDGLNDNNVEEYLRMINNLRDHNLLGRTLVSHDAGWYDPDLPNGGKFRGFLTLTEKLIPRLRAEGYTQDEIDQLLINNPANAFSIKIKKAAN